MLACSVERGLINFLNNEGNATPTHERYRLLFNLLLDKYAEKEGTLRHIGLLFAMLPKDYQPVDALRSKFATQDTFLEYTPADFFNEQGIDLLPSNYKGQYNPTTESFTITPTLQLMENVEGEITSTIFGPLSSQPLTRTKPNLGRKYYTLLGISGGVGCALTHSLVIPLDVVK
jgi:hypothetical protein